MTNLIIKFRLVFIFFVFFFLFNTSPSLAVQSYNHNTAGFVIEVPTGWELNITLKGMELSHKESLLSFEYLGNSKVDVVDIIDYFLPKDENNSTFTGVMIKVQKPYPGLRTTITDIGYTAEIAVLNTPVGYYLLSLEQEKHNITNKQVFEKMLENFTLLDTQPFNDNANFLQPVNIGSLDVYVPQGELELQANSFIWKSDAAGLLSAEIVTQKQNQPLIVFLDDWENNMLASKAGLERRTSKLLLSVDDRKTIIADYTGKDIQARVHISKINEKSVILLALITLQKTFASHEQLLDTACFSIILPEQPTNNTENTTTTEKTENKLNISSNISPVVNPAIVTKPKKKAGSGSKSNLNSGDRKISRQLRSGTAEDIRYAAKLLYKGHYQNRSLLDLAAKILKNGYKKKQNKMHIDAMSWICKALGKSGKKKYRPLLKKVERNAPSRKLQKYAKKSASQL